MGELLDDDQIRAGLTDLPGWDRSGDDAIRAVYRAPTFLAGIGLVDAVAVAADRADHHPDIDIRYDTVTFVLSTHSAGGLTAKDLDLAGEIVRAAGDAGVPPA